LSFSPPITAIASGFAATNPVQNGDFSTTTTPWTLVAINSATSSPSFTIESFETVSGTPSDAGRIVTGQAPNSILPAGHRLEQTVGVCPGSTISFDAAIRINTTCSGGVIAVATCRLLPRGYLIGPYAKEELQAELANAIVSNIQTSRTARRSFSWTVPNTFVADASAKTGIYFTRITTKEDDVISFVDNFVVNDPLPSITCGGAVNLPSETNVCSASVPAGSATASDNCGSPTVTYSQTSVSVGTQLITATATDAIGNTATCQFQMTVTDNQDPTLIVNDVTLVISSPLQCSAVPGSFSVTFNDNCPGATISYSHSPSSSFPKGETVVTATVTDASSRSVTKTFKVIVQDPNSFCCSGGSVQFENAIFAANQANNEPSGFFFASRSGGSISDNDGECPNTSKCLRSSGTDSALVSVAVASRTNFVTPLVALSNPVKFEFRCTFGAKATVRISDGVIQAGGVCSNTVASTEIVCTGDRQTFAGVGLGPANCVQIDLVSTDKIAVPAPYQLTVDGFCFTTPQVPPDQPNTTPCSVFGFARTITTSSGHSAAPDAVGFFESTGGSSFIIGNNDPECPNNGKCMLVRGTGALSLSFGSTPGDASKKLNNGQAQLRFRYRCTAGRVVRVQLTDGDIQAAGACFLGANTHSYVRSCTGDNDPFVEPFPANANTVGYRCVSMKLLDAPVAGSLSIDNFCIGPE